MLLTLREKNNFIELIMTKHSIVKGDARALSLLEKKMLSAGIKNEKPADPGEKESSVKTKKKLGKFYLAHNPRFRLSVRKLMLFPELPRKLDETVTSYVKESVR